MTTIVSLGNKEEIKRMGALKECPKTTCCRRTDEKEYLKWSKGADAVQIPTHDLSTAGSTFSNTTVERRTGYLQVFIPKDYGGDSNCVFFLSIETDLNLCAVGGRCSVYRTTRESILILTPVYKMSLPYLKCLTYSKTAECHLDRLTKPVQVLVPFTSCLRLFRYPAVHAPRQMHLGPSASGFRVSLEPQMQHIMGSRLGNDQTMQYTLS